MPGQVQRGKPRIPQNPGPKPRLNNPKPISGQLEEATLSRVEAQCKRLKVSRCDFLRDSVEAYLELLEKNDD